jgi:hypothetical protein
MAVRILLSMGGSKTSVQGAADITDAMIQDLDPLLHGLADMPRRLIEGAERAVKAELVYVSYEAFGYSPHGGTPGKSFILQDMHDIEYMKHHHPYSAANPTWAGLGEQVAGQTAVLSAYHIKHAHGSSIFDDIRTHTVVTGETVRAIISMPNMLNSQYPYAIYIQSGTSGHAGTGRGAMIGRGSIAEGIQQKYGKKIASRVRKRLRGIIYSALKKAREK